MKEAITLNSRGQITLPFTLRKSLGLTNGTKLIAVKMGKNITLQPILTIEKRDVMSLYGSVSAKGKTIDPDKAIALAKKIKSQESLDDVG